MTQLSNREQVIYDEIQARLHTVAEATELRATLAHRKASIQDRLKNPDRTRQDGTAYTASEYVDWQQRARRAMHFVDIELRAVGDWLEACGVSATAVRPIPGSDGLLRIPNKADYQSVCFQLLALLQALRNEDVGLTDQELETIAEAEMFLGGVEIATAKPGLPLPMQA